jgi:predicted transcriptional regulator
LNPGFKTKSEEIQWRRAKILELKSQGLDQRDIAQVLHVSPTTITFDLQYLHKEARETIREYTTEQLPLQLRVFMVANQNAIKQYWDISQKAQDNKEKIQALEHYLDCHTRLWTLLYGGEDHMVRFGKSMPPQQFQYKEDELAFTEGKP